MVLQAVALMLVAVVPVLQNGGAAAPAEAPAAITAVSYRSVTVGGPFWGPRLKVLREATLDANRHQCDITGRLANFDRAAKKNAGVADPGAFEGLLFNDSDVYKMMEGWAYAVANEPDPEKKAKLEADLDAVIARVAAAQRPDGYIDTYYILKAGIDRRFTREEWDHETYCMGHLIEAGVAHYEATGKKNLLDVAVRAADFLHNLYTKEGFAVPSGHEEVEVALVRLAGATGDGKYTKLAAQLVELRGRPHRKLDGTVYGPWGDYAQDHKPASEQFEAAGHAVRAGYLYSAMADLARLGHSEYTPALEHLWDDVTQRRIFVTGGIGPSGSNEGFTVPYDIPIRSAYQETCASIALCMWAHRMFLLEGDAKYMEQFERTLYNAALAGVSLDGKRFFYVNPMMSRGGETRQAWFGCACCPPNVLRFFGELGQYIYAVKGDTVYVNLLVQSKATVMVDGKPVEIELTTDQPFGGHVRLAVRNGSGRMLRVAVRGKEAVAGMDSVSDARGEGYGWMAAVAGQTAVSEWDVPLAARRVYSDPRVKASLGRTAVMRGPLVYTAEAIDNGGKVSDLVLPAGGAITEARGADGVPFLTAGGFRSRGADAAGLYSAGAEQTPAKITLRPYFMWANRGPCEMAVWLPESAQFLGPAPMKGLKASVSFVGHGDGVDAMSDRVLPEHSSDESVPRLTFWPHKGAAVKSDGEWVSYEFETARRVTSVGVYWFDDTGHGECRVPKGCVLEYRDGGAWKPVEGGAVGVKKDVMNTAAFQPVTTTGLRLRIELEEGMSAGILEWTFGG